MELEFFIKPDEAIEIIHGRVAAWSAGADLSSPQPNWGWEMWHRYWVEQRTRFYAEIGLGAEVLDYHWQTTEELAHYARACVDILFKFPFGTEELEGIAARGDFDLSQHQKHCGKPLEFFDEELKLAAARLSADRKRGNGRAGGSRAKRRNQPGALTRGGGSRVVRPLVQGLLRPARHRALRRPRPARARGPRPCLFRNDEDRREGPERNHHRAAIPSAPRARSRSASFRCSRTSPNSWPKRAKSTTCSNAT